jgi:hypothetical protein
VTTHTAYIYDRGGRKRIRQLENLASVKWNRGRDQVSQATVTILGADCGPQADVLEMIEPHRHELVIFRGDDRVWEGPINRATDDDPFQIMAYDIFQYLLYTPLTKVWSNAYPNVGTVTQRIADIMAYELTHGFPMPDPAGGPDFTTPAWESLDPPVNVLPYLVAHHFPNEAQTSATTQPYQMSVGDHIQSLARVSGIDYTVVGRALHVWDTSRPLGQTRTMVDNDFNNTIVGSSYGSDHAEFALVPTDGEDNLVGRATSPAKNYNYYGPWTKIFTTYDESDSATLPTIGDLDSQAQRNIAGRSPVPFEVRVPDNSNVYLSDTLTINDLVPGVRVPLLATLNVKKVSQLQKIDLVTVSEDSTGETVQVTLSPASSLDSDDEDDS